MIDRPLGPNVTPELRLEARHPHLRTDPYELEWILPNLLMDSREPTPKRGRVGLPII